MLGEYTNKKMAATSPCQLQNNTMIETRCYPSSVLCICLWLWHRGGIRSLTVCDNGVFVEPEEWEDFDGDDDVVDLRAYAVLGGVFHFNLLHLPPQPKVVKDWTITQGILLSTFISRHNPSGSSKWPPGPSLGVNHGVYFHSEADVYRNFHG